MTNKTYQDNKENKWMINILKSRIILNFLQQALRWFYVDDFFCYFYQMRLFCAEYICVNFM